MSLLGKHSNRHKQALHDRHSFGTASDPNTAHHEGTTRPTPLSDFNREFHFIDDRYQSESSSLRPTVSRSQSTRNPCQYPNQAANSQQFPIDDLREHHRHASQTSSSDLKKGKRFFHRMLTNSIRTTTDAKPYPPSAHRNTPGLIRRVSANDASLTNPSIKSISFIEELKAERQTSLYSSSTYPSAHEENEVNAGPEPFDKLGQVGPSILRKRHSVQADQGDPKTTNYKLLLEEQRQHLQDQIPYKNIDAPQYPPEQGYYTSSIGEPSQTSLIKRDSYRCQYSETDSQLSLESQEDQRSIANNEVFPNHSNQQLHSILQSHISRSEPQHMALPGVSSTSRRSADQKLALQVQQEARDGQSSNFNRSQFSNNQPPTPGLSPLPQGSQASTYRTTSQRDQYNTQNEQGRKTPPPPSVERDLSDTYKELVTKYKKVKGLYFEKTAQVEQLQNTLANQRLSQSRTSLDDSEYMTRFQRLEGAVTNLAFNIRKDWRTVPFWISQYVNHEALKIGKQEMTAVGRAVITKFLVDELFNLTFHPGLPNELSSSLKAIERNIRWFSPALNNQEESDALNFKVVQWRLATLDGLKDILALPESEENKKQFARLVTTKLTGYIIKFLQEPIPPGLENSAHMIVELAVGIASNLPLESREICIIHPMPGDTLQPAIMKLENPIPALFNPGAVTEDNESTQSGEKEECGKEKKGHGILQGMMSGNSSGKRENCSESKKTEDGGQKIRFSGFVGVEVRGRQVLFKAPVWTWS